MRKFDWLFMRVLRCARMNSPDDYLQESANHPDWPKDPREFCGQEWEGWGALLSKHIPRNFHSFNQLLIYVGRDHIDSKEKYYQRCLQLALWPMNPQTAYQDEWTGWDEFFLMASSIRMSDGNTNIPIHLVHESAQS